MAKHNLFKAAQISVQEIKVSPCGCLNENLPIERLIQHRNIQDFDLHLDAFVQILYLAENRNKFRIANETVSNRKRT